VKAAACPLVTLASGWKWSLTGGLQPRFTPAVPVLSMAFSEIELLEGYGIKTVAPRVMPDSMASCAFTASFSGYS
jgi:hypothetical protein